MSNQATSETAAKAYRIIQAHPDGIKKIDLARKLGYDRAIDSLVASLKKNYQVYEDNKRLFASSNDEIG